jgi:hypothetical protein
MSIPTLFQTTADLITQWWWLWLPVFAVTLLWQTWLIYIRSHYYINTKWDLLEIRVPREIAKTPQAMEQALAGLHGASRKGNLIDRYRDGFIPTYFSLEIVSRGGMPHFYIRTPSFFRHMVEAQIYAQYPQSEIRIVDDYIDDVPPTAPDENWNLYGSEFTFTKPDAFPLLTYPSFHITEGTKEEAEKVDPLSALLEFFGSLSKDEHMWLQILIRPTDEKWKETGEKLIAKMIGKKVPPEAKKGVAVVGQETKEVSKEAGKEGMAFLRALFGIAPPKEERKEKKKEELGSLWQHLSKGEQEVVVSMQKKIAKLGFETGIRFCYIARKDRYTIAVYPALIGIMKQFNSQLLNGFKPKNSASVDYPPLKKRREAWKKRTLLALYRERSWFYPPYTLYSTPSAADPRYWFSEKKSFISRLDPTTNRASKSIILSTEELATIYHFPGMVAAAPAIERIEAKKVEPPPNLPLA